MTPEQIARFHVHICDTCNEHVGCTSPTCDRRRAGLAHPDHRVPELVRLERGAIVETVGAVLVGEDL
jgi:hypothetical protein